MRAIRSSRESSPALLRFALQDLKKEIPGAPADEVPVHMRQKQIFANFPQEDVLERPLHKAMMRDMEKTRERWESLKKKRDEAAAAAE